MITMALSADPENSELKQLKTDLETLIRLTEETAGVRVSKPYVYLSNLLLSPSSLSFLINLFFLSVPCARALFSANLVCIEANLTYLTSYLYFIHTLNKLSNRRLYSRQMQQSVNTMMQFPQGNSKEDAIFVDSDDDDNQEVKVKYY